MRLSQMPEWLRTDMSACVFKKNCEFRILSKSLECFLSPFSGRRRAGEITGSDGGWISVLI